MQLQQLLANQREWSLKTFGPGRRTVGLIKHIIKELDEIEQKPDDPLEWVDVFILAMDGAHRTDCPIPDIVKTFERIHSVLNNEIVDFLDCIKHTDPTVDEWVTIACMAVEALRQLNYDRDEIFAMIEAKQLVNINRQWPAWTSEDQPSEHVREGE